MPLEYESRLRRVEKTFRISRELANALLSERRSHVLISLIDIQTNNIVTASRCLICAPNLHSRFSPVYLDKSVSIRSIYDRDSSELHIKWFIYVSISLIISSRSVRSISLEIQRFWIREVSLYGSLNITRWMRKRFDSFASIWSTSSRFVPFDGEISRRSFKFDVSVISALCKGLFYYLKRAGIRLEDITHFAGTTTLLDTTQLHKYKEDMLKRIYDYWNKWSVLA